jgi:Family of unknown function (DUF5427)
MASKKSKQEEALQFLDDLDSFAPPTEARSTTKKAQAGSGNEGEAAEVLAFLDEITQKSTELPARSAATHISRSGTPTLRKSTERVRLGGGTVSGDSTRGKEKAEPQPVGSSQSGSGAWGWGSVWSTASAAIQQAKTVVDEQVKHLPKNEQARKWGENVMEYAKTAQLDKLSASLTLLTGPYFLTRI